MEDEKEKISIELSIHGAAALERLARQYKLSASEVVERLLKKADSAEATKVMRKGGVAAQTAYYDKPKL